MKAPQARSTSIPLPVVGDQQGQAPEATCRPDGEEELLREGWMARFVGDERMIADSVANYSALGFEVTTLPVDCGSLSEACAACAPTVGSFHVIYTRRAG